MAGFDPSKYGSKKSKIYGSSAADTRVDSGTETGFDPSRYGDSKSKLYSPGSMVITPEPVETQQKKRERQVVSPYGTFLGGFSFAGDRQKTAKELADEKAQQELSEQEYQRLLGLELDKYRTEVEKAGKKAQEEKAPYNIHAFGGYDANRTTEAERQYAAMKADLNKAESLQYDVKGREALDKLTEEQTAALEVLASTEGVPAAAAQADYDRKVAARETLLASGLSEDELSQLVNYQRNIPKREKNAERYAEVQEMARNEGEKSPIGGTLLSVPANLLSGIGTVYTAVEKLRNPDTPADYHSPAMLPYAYASGVRGEVTKNLQYDHGDAAAFAYGVGTSMLDSAATAALAALGVPPAAASATLGGAAATDAMVAAKDRGLDDSHAIVTGVAAGVMESFFEKVSLESLIHMKLPTGTAKQKLAGMLKNAAIQGGIEGSEEMFTDLANLWWDKVINGDMADVEQRINAYMAGGMSHQEAQQKVVGETIKDIAVDFGAGALAGGLMGGGNMAVQTAVQHSNELTAERYRQFLQEAGVQLDDQQSAEDTALTEASDKYGAQAEVFRSTYAEGQDVALYDSAYRIAYEYGKAGAKEEAVMQQDSLSYLSETQRKIAYIAGREAAAWQNGLGENGSKAWAKVQNADVESKGKLQAGFTVLYQAGLRRESAANVKSAAASALPQSVQTAAYEAGLSDAAASLAREKAGLDFVSSAGSESGLVDNEHARKMAKDQAGTAALLNTLGKNLGVRIEMVDTISGGKANGVYISSRNLIQIAADANTAVDFVAAHEVTHRMQELAPEEYRAYRDHAMSYRAKVLGEETTAGIVAEYMADAEAAGVKLTQEEAMDEIAANFTEDMMENGKLFEDFAKENRSAARKLLDALKAFIAKVKSLFRSKAAQDRAAQDAYGKSMAELEQCVALWQKAYDAAGKQAQRARVSDAVQQGDTLQYDDAVYSLRVTDKDTLDFLNGQKTIKTYKTMQIVDGKLYPPMAARVDGKYEDASELGKWEMAVERPDLVKDGKFKLDKGKGQGSLTAAYNPYMHSSNLVINDQFSGAYTRNNLVTVECEVPASEMTSGYHAEGAKDGVGWHSWHTGTVAGQIRRASGTERKVFLSRWIKPVRILPDAEVAGMYKDLLGDTGIAVPDNVVTPSLLEELRKAGVAISESGRVKAKTAAREGDGEGRYQIKNIDGRLMTVIDTQNDTRDFKAAEAYLKTLVNTDHPFSTILMDAQPVFVGKDLPGEYKSSEYTKTMKPALRKIKMQAATNLDEMLLLAENGEWRENVKPKHAKDAQNGWYRYDTEFAVPVLDAKKTVDHYTVYGGTLLIRNDADGKSYLYDLLDVEKKKVISKTSFSAETHSEVTSPKPSTDSISTSGEKVNGKFSLKAYSDVEKKQHVKDAKAFFGRTYKWAETGYITTDGARLDFSGKHEGGPGGYRTVDHRDIRDALGDDYGGDDYSGAMVQFMGEGNIRISPESGGINLSVMPTKAQMDTLSDFISKERGEVVLDLDDTNGVTLSSTEYPRGTHSSKVLNDIKAFFETGAVPQVSELGRFRYQLKNFSEQAVSTALYDALSEKATRQNQLIPVSVMPRYISEKLGIGGDIYIQRDHAYENMVSKEQAIQDGRPTQRKGENVHFHDLGVEKMTRAIMSINEPTMTISTKTKDGNPAVIMMLPEYGSNDAPLYAVLSFYSSKSLNGDFSVRPHVVLTIAERNFFEDGGRVGWDEVIYNAINDGRVLDFNKKERQNLTVIAQPAGLGNITDASLKKNLAQFQKEVKRFRESNNIRYQLKSATELEKEVRELKKERRALENRNRVLTERVAKWRGELRRTETPGVRPGDVKKLGRQFLSDYGSSTDYRAIEGDMTALGKALMADDVSMDTLRPHARAAAEKIIDGVLVQLESGGELLAIRDHLKNVTLRYTDDGSIPEFKDWRRANRRTLKISDKSGLDVDVAYSELTEMFGEGYFPSTIIHPGDQLLRMSEVLDNVGRIYENPFDGYRDAAVTELSDLLIDGMIGEDVRQSNPTFADRQALELQETKARLTQMLIKTREGRDRQVERMRRHYQEQTKAGRERRNATALRAKIARHTADLSRKLLTPTDKQHIPEKLRQSVAALLGSINQESAYSYDENGKLVHNADGDPTKRTQAAIALKNAYDEILRSGEALVIDPDLLGSEGAGLLDQVMAFGNKRIADMNSEELTTVWQAVRAIEQSVSTFNKNLAIERYAGVQELAEALRDGTFSRKRANRKLALDLYDPYTFFYAYGEAGMQVYRTLRNAQDKQNAMLKTIQAAAEKFMDKEVYKNRLERHEFFVGEDGQRLVLTTGQIMNLYNLVGRGEQAVHHLTVGGVVQPAIKKNGKQAAIERGTENIRLTADDLTAITGTLSDAQRKVAEGFQKIASGDLAKWGNEASMTVYGYQKFTEGKYWPIKAAQEGTTQNSEKGADVAREIKNMGSAKALTPNASNALEMGDMYDVFAQNASDMIQYSTLLAPMEDINRLYNYRYRDAKGNLTGKNVKHVLTDVYGEAAQKYWRNLMRDVQNGMGSTGTDTTRFIEKMVGGVKGASVGFNLRVVAQQPTAYVRAAAILDPSTMAKGIVGGATEGNGWEKAKKYAPIASIKDTAGFDQSSRYSIAQNVYGGEGGVMDKLNDWSGWAAGKADAVTWGAIWNACEWTVVNEGGYEKGSDAFFSRVAQVFTEVIDQSQVVDGIMQRTQIMRDANGLTKQATAFMGEPLKTLNMFMRSYDAWRFEQNIPKRSAAMKKMTRTIGAVLVTDVVNALVQSLVDAARDDDKDKGYWARYLEKLTGVTGDKEKDTFLNVLLGSNLWDNADPLGRIPYAKDIKSLMQGFTVSRMDADAAGDFITAAEGFVKSLQGEGKKTPLYAAKQLLTAGSKIFSVSVANVGRDVWAIARSIAQSSGNIRVMYEMERAIWRLAPDAGNNTRYYKLLYMAMEQDKEAYQYIYEDMKKRGYSDKQLQDGIKKIIKDSDVSDTDMREQLEEIGYSGEDAQEVMDKWEATSNAKEWFGSGTEWYVARAYTDYAEPAGIDRDTFLDFYREASRTSGEDLDGDGKTDSGSKKKKVLALIDGMALSATQKDALYYQQGYAESTIGDAPWH